MKRKAGLICLIGILAIAGIFTGIRVSSGLVKKSIIDDNYRNYYEVFVYSFCDSNGDGIGDIPGLTSRLDYITDLGFNGIWLMPIMPSTSYHKYDVLDYYDIDPQYGTLDDFKNLMEECNKRNIHVLIDLVFNHTSNEHPWFIEASNYLKTLNPEEEPDFNTCSYADYYHFEKDTKKTSYYKIGDSQWYYEGMFWSGMPDLNLENEKVRKEIEDISKYWLDLGVSGFRLDAAKEYFSGNNDKNLEVLSWYSNYVKSQKPDAYLVAEVWDSFDMIAKYYKSGIDSIFNFVFGNQDGLIVKTLNRGSGVDAGIKFAKNLVIVQDKFLESNSNMIDTPFLSNHDTGRIAGFVGKDEKKVKLAGAMNIMMGGSVFVYYGEELGMTGYGKDENKRVPMYWTEEFSQGMTTPPPNSEPMEHLFGAFETQKKDKYSIYSFYKKALQIRKQYPEIPRGTVKQMEQIEDGDICGISKTYKDSKIYILHNIGDEEKEILVSKEEYTYSKIAEQLMVGKEKAKLKNEILTIPAYGTVILK